MLFCWRFQLRLDLCRLSFGEWSDIFKSYRTLLNGSTTIVLRLANRCGCFLRCATVHIACIISCCGICTRNTGNVVLERKAWPRGLYNWWEYAWINNHVWCIVPEQSRCQWGIASHLLYHIYILLWLQGVQIIAATCEDLVHFALCFFAV